MSHHTCTSSPVDRLVRALELGYREGDRQAAAAELQQLDAAGHELIGKLFVSYLAKEFGESTSRLEDWAIHYAETGDDGELVGKLRDWYDDDNYPEHMITFWESEAELTRAMGRHEEAKECDRKVEQLRQRVQAAKGGAA